MIAEKRRFGVAAGLLSILSYGSAVHAFSLIPLLWRWRPGLVAMQSG